MTTTLTTNFSLPIPPLDSGGTTDGYATLMQTADTAIANASGKGAWTDYSATSTIVGWDSYTTKVIRYKKVGTIMHVFFYISGGGSAILDVSTFTLPNTALVDTIGAVGRVVNNSTAEFSGWLLVSGTGVNLYRGTGTGAWATGGTKTAAGQFFYEVA